MKSAAIRRVLIQDIIRKTPLSKAHVLRSVVGHYIAGTAGVDELDKVLNEMF